MPEASDDEATDDDISSGSDDNHDNTINGSALPSSSTLPKFNVIDLTGVEGGQGTRQVIDLSTPRWSPIPIASEGEKEEGPSGVLNPPTVPTSYEPEEPLASEHDDHREDQELDELHDEYDTDEEYEDGFFGPDTRADHDSPDDYPEEDSEEEEYWDEDKTDEDADGSDDPIDEGDMDSIDSDDGSEDYGLDVDSSGENSFPLYHDTR